MNGILYLHLRFISLFKECFCILSSFSNCSRFPIVVSTWWIKLCKMWSFIIVACYQYWYTKWTISTWLCLFLNKFWCLSAECLNTHWFKIFNKIILNKFSCFLTQYSEIRTKTRIDSTDMFTINLCFKIRILVH